jgi:hypothetical protein
LIPTGKDSIASLEKSVLTQQENNRDWLNRNSTAHDMTIEKCSRAGIHTGSFGSLESTDEAEVFECEANKPCNSERNNFARPLQGFNLWAALWWGSFNSLEGATASGWLFKRRSWNLRRLVLYSHFLQATSRVFCAFRNFGRVAAGILIGI